MRWSLRTRLLLLFVFATAPIAVLSVVAIERAEAASRHAIAAAAIADTVWIRDLIVENPEAQADRIDTLPAMSAQALASQPGCTGVLAAIAHTTSLGRDAFALVDAKGHPLCGTAAPMSSLPAVATPYTFVGFTSAGEPGLVTASVLPGNAAYVIVTTPLHGVHLPAGAEGWMVDGATAVPLGATQAALPSLDPHDAGGDGVADPTVRAVRDHGATYGVATLGHLRLIVLPLVGRASSATALALRALALIALVGACLTAAAYGIRRLVVAPIERIDHAVERWRRGGRYAPGSMANMPRELTRLSATFEQATTTLAAHELAVVQSRRQQDLLMQEIHHRVKNNLQIVASMLNLQSSRIRQPEARAAFRSARDRIHALATLHRHLYAHGELQTINMRSFLVELCNQLLQALGEVDGERITLDIAAPELQMTSDQAVPLALIVTETVSNAVKFAFPEGRRGCIQVHLALDGELARLEIRDDGLGLPATTERASDGIGLRLIEGFARQLGASLQVTDEAGTRYVIVMPLQRERDEPATAPAGERVDA